jgi:hypothetical protein
MYPYFDAVVGLQWSYDPENYAGGSVATGIVRFPMPDRSKVIIQKKGLTWSSRLGG